MRLYFGLLAFWIALVFGQGGQECTAEMVRTDDCAAVINPAACYNQFRFNANTLRCIEGTDNADRARKACKCCSCVGQRMCDWVRTQRLCEGGAGGGGGLPGFPPTGKGKGKGFRKRDTYRAIKAELGIPELD